MSNVLAQLWNTTLDEKCLILAAPAKAWVCRELAQTAGVEAERRFGKGSLHNGAGDAFRHCYWNALMTRDVGEVYAFAFATAHESGSNTPAEKEMDLHNNEVGVQIGMRLKTASDQELAIATTDALAKGELIIIKQGISEH